MKTIYIWGVTIVDCNHPQYSATAQQQLQDRMVDLALKTGANVVYTTVL